MSVMATYTCDQCGRVKGETNHWFAIQEMGTRSTLMPTFRLMGFGDSGSEFIHLCGEACVMARVSFCLREISAKADEIEQSCAMEEEDAARLEVEGVVGR